MPPSVPLLSQQRQRSPTTVRVMSSGTPLSRFVRSPGSSPLPERADRLPQLVRYFCRRIRLAGPPREGEIRRVVFQMEYFRSVGWTGRFGPQRLSTLVTHLRTKRRGGHSSSARESSRSVRSQTDLRPCAIAAVWLPRISWALRMSPRIALIASGPYAPRRPRMSPSRRAMRALPSPQARPMLRAAARKRNGRGGCPAPGRPHERRRRP